MQAAAGAWAVARQRPPGPRRRRQTHALAEGPGYFEAVGNNPRKNLLGGGKRVGRDRVPEPLFAFVRESVAEAVGPLRSNRGRGSIIHRAPARWSKRDDGRWLILADAALNGDVAQAQIEELAGKIQAPVGPSSPLLDMESTSSIDQVEPPGMLNEYSDQDGNRFNVYLSNTDAPAGMTKLEVRGTDRANLLGSLCTSLARMEISIVSGIISTGDDGIVRNTLFVRRQDRDDGNSGIIIGGRLEEEEFGPVSLQVLSACWTSEERDWLKTRSGGRFVSNRRQPAPFGPGQIGKTERLMAAEARMRAVSARMADVNLAVDALSDSDLTYEDMFTELTDAVSEVADAKAEAKRLNWATMNASIDFETMQAKEEDTGQGSYPFGVTPFVRGVVFMNLAALLFGSNQVVIKQVTDTGLDDFTQMFLRFGIASFMLLPFVWKGARSPQGGQMAAASFQLGTLLAVGYLLQIIGIDGTTAARGALTSTFTVLSVPVFANLSGQRVPWYTWPASLMGVFGVALLTNSGGDPTYADALCVLSATVFGYHMHVSGNVAPKFEDQELPFVAMQLTVVGVEAGIFKLGEIVFEAANGGPDLMTVIANVPATTGDVPWAPLVYMGVVTTAFTLFIEFIAFQSIPASLAALIYTAEPLWGAAFAWHFMGDRWGGIGWAGAGLIVIATVGSQYLSFKEDVKTDENAAPAVLP